MSKPSPFTLSIATLAQASGKMLSMSDLQEIEKQVYDPVTNDGLVTHIQAILDVISAAPPQQDDLTF